MFIKRKDYDLVCNRANELIEKIGQRDQFIELQQNHIAELKKDKQNLQNNLDILVGTMTNINSKNKEVQKIKELASKEQTDTSSK